MGVCYNRCDFRHRDSAVNTTSTDVNEMTERKGNRISKVVTKTGDDGTTGLCDGSRILKSDPRIYAIGDVDELNTIIGMARVEIDSMGNLSIGGNEGYVVLEWVQHRLFDLGGELSFPSGSDVQIIDADDVGKLELEVEFINEHLPPLKNFIIPGGNAIAAKIHHARAVARRAERALIVMSKEEPVNEYSRKFLNRLSDYLFVLARHHVSDEEVLWQPKEKN